jgi:hypothetical protein
MNAKLRTWLVVPLLVGAVLAASCAAERKKAAKQVVIQYLDDEVAGDYYAQHELYDSESAKVLPLPVGELTNPFSPKQLTAYALKNINVQGSTADAEVKATFQMMFSGGGAGLPETHYLTIYLVHEVDQWKVNEVKTRTAALDAVIAPGSGSTWLMVQKQKRQFPGQ